ncbi:uncharacterized protein LOC115782085 isoform X1 [Archocentrus centrarchus]|uniref:uncharacterized protein LOC115782085 isoform X1 n=1 Tax=Archocentrus centrarchus TaxID=63155 RepID=UPI0011EA1379|nr:uncharacterized protein LOC115782085 isoform X1 [Archocentrus centrarchus]
MWLYAWFLPAACFCYSSAEPPKVTVLEHSDAVLSCPHAQGDVTWSRHKGGLLTLLTVRNGQVSSSDQRFSSRENHELVIRNVVESDTSMYLCNGEKTAYLEVTTDPNKVDPKDQPVTQRNEQTVTAAGADIKHSPSDLWKVPVAVLGGAALVFLSLLTLRLWKAKKAARNTSGVETGHEVVYEEIGNDDVEPGRRESEVESPYYCSEIREPPNTCTVPTSPLYSTVHKPRPGGREAETCVYYFSQNPSQTS